MNKKQKSSIILASLATIAVSGSLIAGATYALFTSESTTNIAVTSGKVNVTATIENMLTYTGKDLTGMPADDVNNIKLSTDYGLSNGKFMNGGTATLTDDGIKLSCITPGDKVAFDIKITNNSNVAIKYRTKIMCDEDDGLFSGLKMTLGEEIYEGRTTISNYESLEQGKVITTHVEIELPTDAGNEYQGKTCTILNTVEAVQGNAETSDPEEGVFEIYTVNDLVYFQRHASEIKKTSYPKGVKLKNSLDLNNMEWTPIDWDVNDFSVFDGGNFTISNFVISEYLTNDSGVDNDQSKNCGLFGGTTGIYVNNLTIEGADVAGFGRVGAIVGKGLNVHIDNCKVINSKITAVPQLLLSGNYDNGDKAGAIIGQAGEDTNYLTNCSVEDCTIKAYRDLGGIAGHFQKSGSTFSNNSIKNTTIIQDYSLIKATKDTIGKLVGRKDGGFVVDETTNAIGENVVILTQYADGFLWNATKSQYEVSSVNGLKYFRDKINAGLTGSAIEGLEHFVVDSTDAVNKLTLTDDIDLNNEEWEPINTSPTIHDNPTFIFDGRNHTISNLKVVSTDGKASGLFGDCYFTGSAFKKNDGLPGFKVFNLTIENATVTKTMVSGGKFGAAALVAQATSVYLNNVHAKGKINIASTGAYDIGVGTLTGYTGGRVIAENCSVVADSGSEINAEEYGEHVGGLFGAVALEGTGKITNCSVEGLTIKGNHCVGGIAGYINNDSVTSGGISNCKVKSTSVTAKGGVAILVGQWKVAPDYEGTGNNVSDSNNTVTNDKTWPA